jgi:phospholipid/cholesterol/gamma-HCH transport system substrate-binding protein
MILTPLVKTQLRIFAVLTVIALGLGLFKYAQVPKMVGVGVYDVTAQYRDASGLYPQAAVTYRGVEVGRVQSLEIEDGISVATLRIDDEHEIPQNAVAELHSTSAIGEQYVDLVAAPGTAGPHLRDGSVIPTDRTVEMPQISPVLDSLNALLASVPEGATRRVLDQTAEGLGGAGPELGSLIDASSSLVGEAQLRLQETTSLIAALEPVLRTQIELRGRTMGYTTNLAAFADELAARDGDLRALLAQGPGGLRQAQQLIDQLQPTLPMLLQNLTTNARVLNTYVPQIKHALVAYPVTLARLQSAVNPRAAQGDVQLDLRASFNDPPACSEGYLPPTERRSPSVSTTRDVDTLAHCTVPTSDPRSVRGARNLPCPQGDGRGPTPASCGLTFPGGVWPEGSRPVAYDLTVADAEPDRPQRGVSASADSDAWLMLVLAPLGLR